jgi:hypothetical protein
MSYEKYTAVYWYVSGTSAVSMTSTASATSVASITLTASFYQKKLKVFINPGTKMTYPALSMWDRSLWVNFI